MTPRRLLTSVLALFVVFGMGVASNTLAAADEGSTEPGASRAAGATPAELNGRTKIEFVSLGGGCRFLDTRNAVGELAAGEVRVESVLDADIPGQGGSASGCQIPAHAIAVDVSLSTAGGSPTNPGYVRVGPGGAAPTATVLQFVKGQGTSVTTTVDLSATQTMAIGMNGATSDLVGDLLGYWQPSMIFHIGGNGSTVFAQGGSAVRTSEGFYTITLDRTVQNHCVPVASSNNFARIAIPYVLNSNTVTVDTTDFEGVSKDSEFYLEVAC